MGKNLFDADRRCIVTSLKLVKIKIERVVFNQETKHSLFFFVL